MPDNSPDSPSDEFLSAIAHFPETGPLMGLDLGTKTIGIAVSNPMRTIATPVTTIRRKKFTPDAEQLLILANQRDVVGFIMGLPLNMDGSEGPRAQASRAFVRNMNRMTPLPFAFWDERLSTAAAERALIALDTKRAKRAEIIDEMAASYILQGAIDRLSKL
ncbi:MAG: Holliday junction resolvase RuvX [bacterium]